MSLKIVYQNSAYKDFRNILAYIFEITFSKHIAEEHVEKIITGINILTIFPRIGHHVNDFSLNEENLRSLVLNDYIVYYEFDDQEVRILHIWHSKKLLPDFSY
jgi:plasmid stabilization system protein ParE